MLDSKSRARILANARIILLILKKAGNPTNQQIVASGIKEAAINISSDEVFAEEMFALTGKTT